MDGLIDGPLFVHVASPQSLPRHYCEQVLQRPEIDEFLDDGSLLFGRGGSEGSGNDLEGGQRVGVLGTYELQHDLVALHGLEDLPRRGQFFRRIDEEDGQAVEQVRQVLLLVVAGGRPREVGPDRLQQHLHAAQLVESQLGGQGVGEQEGEEVAADELVVVDDLVGDVVVGQDAVSEVVEDLGVGSQWFDGLLPQLQQRLDQFQHLQRHLVLLHTLLLPQLLQRTHQTLEHPVLHQPHAHAVVDLKHPVVSGLLGDEVMQEGDALRVDVRVGVAEQFQHRQQQVRLDQHGDVFLREFLHRTEDAVDLLLRLVELQRLRRVLHPQRDVGLVQFAQLLPPPRQPLQRHLLLLHACCLLAVLHIYNRLMEGLLGSERVGKLVLVSLVLLAASVVVGMVRLVTGSYAVGVLVLLGLIWWLLRQVGAFVMYPGSLFLTSSDIEMRYSREIGSRMIACFNALHALSQCIAHRTYHPYQHQTDFLLTVDRHVRAMAAMLGMFEPTLSPRKTALLRNYRRLSHVLDAVEGETVAIADLIAKPRLISSLRENHLPFYLARFAEISDTVREMVEALKTFAPPTGTFELMRFRMSEECLYEIRFGFYNWGALFDYELFSVHSSGDAHIESAIIHSAKHRLDAPQPQSDPASRKTVLFCNPNGVFIQFFGADNEYVTNYLKLGYRVILWNYRGYGESTGTPSIKRSQEDALAVYHFYKSKGFEIEIVHGYSIGGATAVGLMEGLAKGPQLPGDRVRVLIVDRSFSSIGEMSGEFGRAIYNLTRLIFFTDNIDLSRQFQGVRCSKLLIWDYCDEVIPDKASVKNRIIKRRKQAHAKKQQVDNNRLCLSEESTGRQVTVQFEEVVRQLHWTVQALLDLRRDSDSSDKELNQMLEREASATTGGSLESNSIEGLIKMVGRVDGGGIELFHNLGQLDEIRTRKPEYFLHICENYVLGLVCYGSYFPLRPIVHDHARIKAQTIAKVDLLVHQLTDRASPATFRSNADSDVTQLQGNFAIIFQRLRQLVEECFCEEWFALHGSLLPTNNGHNASLTRPEFEVLNEFIRNRLTLQEREAEADSGRLSEQQEII